MTPDFIPDYEHNLKNALSRLSKDPTLRDEDRGLLLAFLEHIKALRVSTGRQAKYGNMLRTASHILRVPWRRAKRKDIEDLVTKLAAHVSTHPYRNDPNAPLWLTTSTNHLNEPMSWIAADKLVKEAGSKAGIRKGWCHMHMFRHGSATRNARFLTDAEMRALYDALGPDKYDDPHEVLFYRLNQEAANREVEREYEASRSAQKYNTMRRA